MSHPLGALADNMAAYAIYATAQTEMRRAYTLIDAGDLDAAANEIESAAHAAEVLAKASTELDRIAHWRRVADARQRFVDQLKAEKAAA
ncbi:hypothetical protein [Actinophytocola algeriensis]|uniref:Ferritin-like metal-binding protein YciE n=1 Tax=Actinophytocola algeriensis TaxID=1768010 RepID=A0A7W7Q7E6_9PSEU|nr:hypothetical protein [Actinophytocola algeriensis]MBB4908059.1 hypothetical protein [Actinophytocola algeriensis]MBE1480089.1 hypothetical protein [Actinophytocola algeriensis]